MHADRASATSSATDVGAAAAMHVRATGFTSSLTSRACSPHSLKPQAIRKVATECSASLQPGATVATTCSFAPGLVKLSRKTRVRLLMRYGTCEAPDVSARAHSLSASKEELMSAPSRCLSAVCLAESSRRSLPAQSTSTKEPPPPRFKRQTACDLDDTEFASVPHVARRCCPRARSSSKCASPWHACAEAPPKSKSPSPLSRRTTGCGPFGARRSRTSLPAISSMIRETASPVHTLAAARSCIALMV
mmetsp:Transcript_57613/g.160506  ORF Transcript_57613/g.160506 Transcript_57613/m.160506 type:complete len:248 (+) Transcript_57613:634-1377(+)